MLGENATKFVMRVIRCESVQILINREYQQIQEWRMPDYPRCCLDVRRPLVTMNDGITDCASKMATDTVKSIATKVSRNHPRSRCLQTLGIVKMAYMLYLVGRLCGNLMCMFGKANLWFRHGSVSSKKTRRFILPWVKGVVKSLSLRTRSLSESCMMLLRIYDQDGAGIDAVFEFSSAQPPNAPLSRIQVVNLCPIPRSVNGEELFWSEVQVSF